MIWHGMAVCAQRVDLTPRPHCVFIVYANPGFVRGKLQHHDHRQHIAVRERI
jgi:hypothetical protein